MKKDSDEKNLQILIKKTDTEISSLDAIKKYFNEINVLLDELRLHIESYGFAELNDHAREIALCDFIFYVDAKIENFYCLKYEDLVKICQKLLGKDFEKIPTKYLDIIIPLWYDHYYKSLMYIVDNEVDKFGVDHHKSFVLDMYKIYEAYCGPSIKELSARINNLFVLVELEEVGGIAKTKEHILAIGLNAVHERLVTIREKVNNIVNNLSDKEYLAVFINSIENAVKLEVSVFESRLLLFIKPYYKLEDLDQVISKDEFKNFVLSMYAMYNNELMVILNKVVKDYGEENDRQRTQEIENVHSPSKSLIVKYIKDEDEDESGNVSVDKIENKNNNKEFSDDNSVQNSEYGEYLEDEYDVAKYFLEFEIELKYWHIYEHIEEEEVFQDNIFGKIEIEESFAELKVWETEIEFPETEISKESNSFIYDLLSYIQKLIKDNVLINNEFPFKLESVIGGYGIFLGEIIQDGLVE